MTDDSSRSERDGISGESKPIAGERVVTARELPPVAAATAGAARPSGCPSLRELYREYIAAKSVLASGDFRPGDRA